MRSIVGAILAATAACLPLASHGQAGWPAKPLKLIIPFAPGGSNDILGRSLAAKLGARLGQSVVIENKGGGGGTIGTELVAKSAPDGYTLLFASISVTTNAAFGKKLGYDLQKDLAPIGRVATTPFAIVVANQVKANTLREWIQLAQSNPGSVNYGSAGIGGINHLGTELLATAAKIELVHVPYKGIGPAFTDLLGGNLQMVLPTLASVMQQMQAGRVRALAVTSLQRSPYAPDLPTAAEAGLPGFELEAWFGLLAPAGIPPAVRKRLNDELNAALQSPDLKEVFAREAAIATPGTPEDFGRMIASEIVRWAKVIKDKNIQLE